MHFKTLQSTFVQTRPGDPNCQKHDTFLKTIARWVSTVQDLWKKFALTELPSVDTNFLNFWVCKFLVMLQMLVSDRFASNCEVIARKIPRLKGESFPAGGSVESPRPLTGPAGYRAF